MLKVLNALGPLCLWQYFFVFVLLNCYRVVREQLVTCCTKLFQNIRVKDLRGFIDLCVIA